MSDEIQSGIGSSDQGGGDLGSRFESGLSSLNRDFHERNNARSEQKISPRENDAVVQDRGRRESLSKAWDSVMSSAEADASWRRSHDIRQAMKVASPGVPLGEVVRRGMGVEKALAANPAGTAETLRRHYHQDGWRYAKAPLPTESTADQRRSTRDAIDRAFIDVSDADDLAEVRGQFGTSFDTALTDYLTAHNQLIADPDLTAAQLAVRYGHPSTEQEHAEIAAQQQREQQVGRSMEWLDRVIQSGRFPGIERLEVQNAIADIFEHPQFQRTGDGETDLYAAYQLALQNFTNAGLESAQRQSINAQIDSVIDSMPEYDQHQELMATIIRDPRFPMTADMAVNVQRAYQMAVSAVKEDAREKAAQQRKAGLSITGSPGAGSVSGGSRKVPGSAREALSNAMGL